MWVRTYPVRFIHGYASAAHDHNWHQLSYASEGVLRVATAESAWVVPPHRAVWIPGGVAHREEIRGAATMRSLYFADTICKGLPRACAVIDVPPLLRELILHATDHGALDASVPSQKRLAQILVDQLSLLAPMASQQLPMPRDGRALRVATRLQKTPASHEDLSVLARRAGASKRTIQRLFLTETHMSFARWRQRMRLLAAIEFLGNGRNVTETAFDVGYESVSAFVSSFRREFGVSPGRFGMRD